MDIAEAETGGIEFDQNIIGTWNGEAVSRLTACGNGEL